MLNRPSPFGPDWLNPINLMLLEVIYSIIIAVICLLIYFKTKNLYSLTKHEGIARFRNTFFYFALAYLSKLLIFFESTSRLLFSFEFLPLFSSLNFLLIGYFSMVALFYLSLTIIARNIKETKRLDLITHLAAIIISIITFLTRSPEISTIIQLTVIFTSIIFLFKKTKFKFFNQNRIIYYSLFTLWIVNLLFVNRFFISTFRIPIYALSVIAFLMIYLKVRKRLLNVKKEG